VTAAPVERVTATVRRIPTDRPESDATLAWDATTAIVVEVAAGGETGIGYTYGDAAIGDLVSGTLAGVVSGMDAMAPGAAWAAMTRAVRNSLASGLVGYAISAVDIALYDLKSRLLGVALADLLGRWHDGVEIYGSGGFTSYTLDELREQAAGWMELGLRRVKIKVGRDPAADPERLRAVRDVIGDDVTLMVDANGGFTPARALAEAHGSYADHGVRWFEEPVSSDDHDGLRRVRDGAPRGMEIAAGEYGSDVFHFARLLAAGAVDVLQADVTRCGGVTGMLRADALAKAHGLPLSAHCAPLVSAHVMAACETAAHIEYFHDHVRVEAELFDGALDPSGGRLVPDASRPGLGVSLRRSAREAAAAATG
jgi:L-alanine-DL-glutamate epimerase-like enolase superfamily enzyme